MEEAHSIGERVRQIRQRRGLSLDVVAGLSGISKPYLSMLERGKRNFNRRGLVENLADVLGCSPADLTGTPTVTLDARAIRAASAIPGLVAALHDTTLDDVPDMATRSVAELVQLARTALAESDQKCRFDGLQGEALGQLVAELHVAAASGAPEERKVALAGLVEICFVASRLAASLGDHHLALTAIGRGFDSARRAERPDLIGLMNMGRCLSLNRVGARRRAVGVADAALAELGDEPGPTLTDTRVTEARGLLHLAAAQLAARDGRPGDITTHLDEATALAAYTGERNHMLYHFGPTNVAAWRLAIAVETDRGPQEADRFEADPPDLSVLGSADRVSAIHFDLARANAQVGGARDAQALRHLDQADRIAPLRIRRDPLTRELIVDLDRRAKRRTWELDSLRRRVGLA